MSPVDFAAPWQAASDAEGLHAPMFAPDRIEENNGQRMLI